jgi:ElaB/YqjD/DUF883 family membrane-anchored ribosome-binding protein
MNMNKHTQAISDDMSQLVEDARALLAATANLAGDKIEEARERLEAGLNRGKDMYERVRDKAVDGAKSANDMVLGHPNQAIAIGVGAGALIGYLIARRCTCNRS